MTPATFTGPKACPKILEAIAQDALDIPTLAVRNSDQLDFYDVSVWSVADALQQAYAVGYATGKINPT